MNRRLHLQGRKRRAQILQSFRNVDKLTVYYGALHERRRQHSDYLLWGSTSIPPIRLHGLYRGNFTVQLFRRTQTWSYQKSFLLRMSYIYGDVQLLQHQTGSSSNKDSKTLPYIEKHFALRNLKLENKAIRIQKYT